MCCERCEQLEERVATLETAMAMYTDGFTKDLRVWCFVQGWSVGDELRSPEGNTVTLSRITRKGLYFNEFSRSEVRRESLFIGAGNVHAWTKVP